MPYGIPYQTKGTYGDQMGLFIGETLTHTLSLNTSDF